MHKCTWTSRNFAETFIYYCPKPPFQIFLGTCHPPLRSTPLAATSRQLRRGLQARTPLQAIPGNKPLLNSWREFAETLQIYKLEFCRYYIAKFFFIFYATVCMLLLCCHHCKWVAHVNLSINGDDDDDDDVNRDVRIIYLPQNQNKLSSHVCYACRMRSKILYVLPIPSWQSDYMNQ